MFPDAVPVVLREKGFRFSFYSEEGREPPHLHVKRGSGELKFWLGDLSVSWSNEFKPAEIREILKIARLRRTFLLGRWHEFQRRKY